MSLLLTELDPGPSHERLVRARDAASGLHALIAIHSTARGPSAGGCRLWHYVDEASARTDALRLSEGMTLKNAAASLPLGGGKAVVMAPDGRVDRYALFASFGEAVERLGGSYVTAEDVGVGPADMAAVATRTRFVAGLANRSGDPSPVTARGVFASLCIGLETLGGNSQSRIAFDPAVAHGRTVAIQGLGNVGWHLAELLSANGARLYVADLDERRVARAAAQFDAGVVAPDEIARVRADVFAPCALGGVLTPASIAALDVQLVCGAANNQLASASDAARLAERGVLYLPDFVVNAGGIINVASEVLGITDPAWVEARLVDLQRTLRSVLREAAMLRIPPVEVAQSLARGRLVRAAA